MYERIVVGTDGSETAQEAVRHAARLAEICGGCELHVVSAFKPVMTSTVAAVAAESMAFRGAEMLQEAEESVAEEVKGMLERVTADLKKQGVKAVGHAMAGEPAEAIIELAEAKNADLIVVGNRGMSGAKRFLLGSVPNRITHHAPCSVLIVQTS